MIPDHTCPGCGVDLPGIDGPTHRYMTSSAACWAKYGELLAREYQSPARMAYHQYTVDAFAAQHPGEQSPQAIQSVALHLASMCAVFEFGHAPADSPKLLQRLAATGQFHALAPPAQTGSITLLHPLSANNDQEHGERVRAWAHGVWQSWGDHHGQVRSWLHEFAGITSTAGFKHQGKK